MKMQHRFLFVIMVILGTNSCYYGTIYNTVLTQKDDFKNRTKTSISFREYAQMLKTNDFFYRKGIVTYLNFQNYHNDSIVFPVNFYLSIDVMPQTDLDNEFFIKTDSNLFKLKFDVIRNNEYVRKDESNTITTNTTTTVKEKDDNNLTKTTNSLFVDSASKPKEKETTTETKVTNTHDISEYTRKKVRGHTILKDDICKDILYSNTIDIRFYLNDTPYDIEFNNLKLKKLKEYFKTTKIE